ncbi:unnamed protein product, partial [Mesorhabditis spiculigera]
MGSGSSSAKKAPPKEEKPPEAEQPPQTDPRLPYANFREVFTLKNFWKTIRRNDKECAKKMFAEYLKQQSENKAKYGRLKNVDVSSIDAACSDPAFEAMAQNYLKVFDDVIGAIEEKPADVQAACDRLMSVGKMHRNKVPGMDGSQFQQLEEPFLFMVQDVLQDRFNEKAETLFRKFFQFCLKFLLEGFSNAVNSPGTDGKYLKFVVISDTHQQLDQIMDRIPDGDVLLHCGDFTNFGGLAAITEFNDLIGQLPHRHKIVIPGNHEGGFHLTGSNFQKKRLELLTNCRVLLDESIKIEGIKIYGSSWHILPGFSFYVKQSEIGKMWAKIPRDTNILMTHEPPKGYCDMGRRGGQTYGDVELLKAVQARNIDFHVFGHIHESYGVMSDGKTIFMNAAQCDQ